MPGGEQQRATRPRARLARPAGCALKMSVTVNTVAFFMNSFYDTNDVLSSSRRTSSVSLQRYMPACGLCAIGLSSSFRWHTGESFDRAEGKVSVVVAAMFRVDYVGRRGS